MTMEKWAKAIKSRELRQIEYLWANLKRKRRKIKREIESMNLPLSNKKNVWPPYNCKVKLRKLLERKLCEM